MLRHFPYIFSVNGDPLTNGVSYQRVGVQSIASDDFLLRRVSGMGTILNPAGSWNLVRPVDQLLALRGNIIPLNYLPIVPEVYFPGPDHGFAFTANNVLRTANLGVIASQVQFQGVLVRESYTDYEEGDWYTAPWTYQQTLTLNWANNIAGVVQPDRLFQLAINDYPFEWQSFEVYQSNGTPYTGSDLFAISFTDATDNQMMDRPILQRAVNAVGGWRAQFPTLPVVYPLQSGLQYTIRSLVDPADPGLPYTFQLVFRGVRRVARRK